MTVEDEESVNLKTCHLYARVPEKLMVELSPN